MNGIKMVASDALSRRSDHIGDDHDNEDLVLLPERLFLNAIDITLKQSIQSKMETDPLIRDTIIALKSSSLPPIRSSLTDWSENEGLLFYKGKCVGDVQSLCDSVGMPKSGGQNCKCSNEAVIF